jgi:hypothetical protein
VYYQRLNGVAWAALLASAAGGVLGCHAQGGPEDDVGTATSAVQSTCVVVQRGTAGAVADTQLANGDPTRLNKNYGTSESSNSGTVPQGGGDREALFRFDTSGVVPPGAAITSATVTLSVTTAAAATVNAHRITSAWGETTVTWNSFAGAFDPAAFVSFGNGGTNFTGNVSFDVTAAAQGWVNTPAQNFGFLLEQGSTPNTRYWTSEYFIPANRPKLNICYATPTCTDGIQDQGELGVDCGGPCAKECAHPPATQVVNAGDTSRSPHFRAVYTFGQPTQNQDKATSPSYRVQGGLIGANGSLP